MDRTDNVQNTVPSRWQKIQAVAVVLTPILVAYFGVTVSSSIEERGLQIKEFEVAVGILKEDPAKSPGSEHLRGWALETFEKYSSVRLSPEDRRRLELWRLDTPRAIDVATDPVDVDFDPVLYITSVPKGATVYIDDTKQSLPTSAFYWTSGGHHRVKWEYQGKVMESDVNIRPGEVVSMYVDFIKGKNWDPPMHPLKKGS